MENCIVLNYYNSLLRQDDLKLLDERRWLNDNVIGFVFEYLENDVYPKYSNELLFVNPGTAQLIKFLEERELFSLVESLSIDTKKLAFFPINDNHVSEAGGSHWSLLVLHVPDRTCYSFDSSMNFNHNETQHVFAKLSQCLLNLKPGLSRLTNTPSPQQTNGYDCGMYLICITEEICKKHISSNLRFDDLLKVITPEFVKKRREDIKILIKKLSQS